MRGSHSYRAYVAWILVCVVWGTTYVSIRIAIETLPPLLMTSVRWMVAGALQLVVAKFAGETLPAKSVWKSLAIVGILMVGFGNGAIVLAEQTVPSGLTALLLAVTPFWMVAVERSLPGAEPLSRRHVVGLLIGFAGVLFLVWPELRAGSGPGFMFGVLATQLGCAGWAAGSNYARQKSNGGGLLVTAAIQMIFGGLFLLVVAVVRREALSQAISSRSIEAMLYLIFVGSIVGFSAYAYALKHLPLSFVSLYAYITPVIAVVLGTVILNEPMTSRVLVASVLVLAGVATVRN